MSREKFLSTKQLAERWDGLVAMGTLENWRMKGWGPKYLKLSKAKTARIVYKLNDIRKFEKLYFKGAINKWRRLR